MRAVVRALVTMGIAVVVASPLARGKGWDDFPLSSYPMFSRGDIASRHGLAHALVVHADGHRSPATPSHVGSPEPMVAQAIVFQAINGRRAAELCAVVAANVSSDVPTAAAVEIAMSHYDPSTYFRDGKHEPDARVVHARCPVKR